MTLPRLAATLLTALCLWAPGLPAPAQQGAPQPEATAQPAEATAAEALEDRAKSSVSTLEALIGSRDAVEADIDRIAKQLRTASEAEKDDLKAQLDSRRNELAEIEDQISILAVGVSETEFNAPKPAAFDLGTEIENLIQPFVLMLKNATEEARQIEDTRRALGEAQTRLATTAQALETLASVDREAETPLVKRDLTERESLWKKRNEAAEAKVAALQQQLDDLLSSRISPAARVGNAANGFFRERGLSTILGIAAFTLVITALRALRRIAGRFAMRRALPRNFQMRLINLLYVVFSVAAGFAAMLIVFHVRNDWLLMGLSAILLIALAWLGIRMLPMMIEQVTLLLNLGAVQERERIVLNGVPYKVQKLDFYTDLVNPSLDGGEFTLPVRELIGLHSRPAAADEAWFPSNKGDWVKLSDGVAGRVIVQTPEMVVLEKLGGARVTYQTGDYLGQTPENLSGGYRVETVFGISYDHQAEATEGIIRTLRARVGEAMAAFLPDGALRGVEVELLRAGASAIEYSVAVDLDGSAAARFEAVERELARLLVGIATAEGWKIPFQTIEIRHP